MTAQLNRRIAQNIIEERLRIADQRRAAADSRGHSAHVVQRARVRATPTEGCDVERLMLDAARRDEDAWSALVERFTGRVRAVARYHRLTAADAEDVVQTTWLRLFEQIGRVRDPGSVGAWLHTTARRECLRIIRDGRRQLPTEESALVSRLEAPAPESTSPTVEERALLTNALAALPERERDLMRMLFRDPAPSYAETSKALRMPIGSIGPTRARCLARLRGDARLVEALEDVS